MQPRGRAEQGGRLADLDEAHREVEAERVPVAGDRDPLRALRRGPGRQLADQQPGDAAALPGRSGLGWAAWGAQAVRVTMRNVAGMRPAASTNNAW